MGRFAAEIHVSDGLPAAFAQVTFPGTNDLGREAPLGRRGHARRTAGYSPEARP